MTDIVAMRDTEHLTFAQIAKKLGMKSWERARDAYNRAKDRQQNVIDEMSPLSGDLFKEMGVLDDPVRPLGVPIPPPKLRSDDSVVTALLWSDSHFGFEDPASLSIVEQIARDAQPTVLAHLGDLLDCYNLSRFDKNPDRIDNLQDEINRARQHLARMRLACPNAEMHLFEGNHEDRMRKTLWNAQPTASTLMRLTKVREALTWPTLLGLDELQVQWHPYHGQSKLQILPKFILTHGTVVRKFSGYSARGEWEKYSKSGASGHVHRLGVFYHRDNSGAHCWAECGCTCLLDPEYAEAPDWQQGCVFLTFEPKTGAVNTIPIYIHKGLAVFDGTVYRA